MSAQTKLIRILPWAVAVAVATVIGMGLSYFNASNTINPWHIAEYITSDLAISHFSDVTADAAAYWPQRIYALAGLLVLFIIGPSLWIFAEIKNQHNKNPLNKGFTWYAGFCLVTVGLIYAVPGTITKTISSQHKWTRSAQSASIDNLKTDLARLAYEAAELYYLPEQAGGLSGHFQSKVISLKEMECYSRLNPNYSYMIAPVKSDSMLTIYGVADQPANDADFKNANGKRGKIQLAVNVDPAHGILHFGSANQDIK